MIIKFFILNFQIYSKLVEVPKFMNGLKGF